MSGQPMRAHEIDWESLPLGKVTDAEIQRQLAEKGHVVSHWTVGRQRRKLGIAPAPSESRRKPRKDVKSEVLSVRMTKFTLQSLVSEATEQAEESDGNRKISHRTIASEILEEWAKDNYTDDESDESASAAE